MRPFAVSVAMRTQAIFRRILAFAWGGAGGLAKDLWNQPDGQQ
jgi:hypothetical protein